MDTPAILALHCVLAAVVDPVDSTTLVSGLLMGHSTPGVVQVDPGSGEDVAVKSTIPYSEHLRSGDLDLAACRRK